VLIPGVFLIYLVAPVAAAFGGHRPIWQSVAIIADVVLFVASYVFMLTRADWTRLLRVLSIVWLALFPIGLALLMGPSQLIYFVYVISPSFFVLPRNVAIMIGAAASAALLIGTRLVDGSADWSSVVTLVVLTVAMVAFSQLRLAQQRMAVLAVAEERSRLARDLHDVLGHSLTTITVKAGLARRVLESGADRERAVAEVRDVEDLARQAMTDVRATVSGYRTASLPAELVGARAALRAAGIAAALPHAVDNVAAQFQETFAYVLREGVTNVIRHSGATRCEVRLGHSWLEVRDDGHASAATAAASRESGGGHGLSGLAERVGEVGGELTAHPLPEGGFLLRVDVAGEEPKTRDSANSVPANRMSVEPSAGLA
jgi:two-component system sensor histidine kinase DesK